jgi:4-alpha-glucanotransferase
MTAWGDLQIGLGVADAARFRRLFLPGYLLGAPPSRTHPLGQAWGCPALDPDTFRDGPDPETSAIALLRARLRRMARDCDGVRIDHPHGLVCPWVYRSDAADAWAAVQHGARLFESPAVSEHPALARFARVRPGQLNHRAARHADDWVVDLEPAQVDAYGVLFDVLVQNAPRLPDGRPALACEVLSTQPFPLRRVMERHGLGRYRVTQKADPHDGRDVYRSENARPEDWIMAGNHDTPSSWRVARAWQGTPHGGAVADLLARRLRPGADPAPLAGALRADPGAFVHAMLADVFASGAENVQLFFTDLLGIEETYNEPGTVGPHNWTLRVPPDWRRHAERAAARTALALRNVLAMALRMRGLARDHAPLLARLEAGRPAG